MATDWADWARLTNALEQRSGGFCEACGRRRLEYNSHRHHRRLRSQGGKDTLDNLVIICRECHQLIHEQPKQSIAEGFIVPSWALPAQVPIMNPRFRVAGVDTPIRPVFLTPEGTYELREEVCGEQVE